MLSNTYFMRQALNLAKRHQGLTADNPSVGCVIVKDGIVIGRGSTALGGRPHAEVVALEQAKGHTDKATAYVTLEPCSHYGRTPPCADALIAAGIKKVFIGIKDPFEKVNGNGIQKLNDAGIITDLGILNDEIRDIYKSFFTVIEKKRPFYTIKFATSLDGKVNFYPDMSRKKISSDYDHLKAHQLRYRHQAIAVGINTVLMDNCRLNCRLKGLESYSPDIIIFDSLCRIPPEHLILNSRKRIFIFHKPSMLPKFKSKNIIYAPIANDLEAINSFLLNNNVCSVLIEGGPTLQTSFLNAGLYDRLVHFQGNYIIGNQAQSAFGDLKSVICP